MIWWCLRRGTASWRDFGLYPPLANRPRGQTYFAGLATMVIGLVAGIWLATVGSPATFFWFDTLIAFPIIEELVYCGILFRPLSTMIGAPLAIPLSVAAFVTLHTIGYCGWGWYAPAIVLWAALGTAADLLYYWRRSLLANIQFPCERQRSSAHLAASLRANMNRPNRLTTVNLSARSIPAMR